MPVVFQKPVFPKSALRGFTLIELLVALVIFVVLAVLSYGGLRAVLAAQENLDRNSDRLGQAQLMFMVIGRDLEQIVPRPIRSNYGDQQPPVTGGGEVLEFTRGGWRNPAGFARSDLQRIAYTVEDGKFLRLAWSVLDRAQDSEPARQVLFDGVSGVELRFLSTKNEWRASWPESESNADMQLPRAIELTVLTEDWGGLTRLFRNTAVKIVADTKKGVQQ